MLGFSRKRENKLDLLLSYIDSLNDRETICYRAKITNTKIVEPAEVKMMRAGVANEIKAMQAKLKVKIDFRGFEWLGKMLAEDLELKSVRRGSFTTESLRRRSSSLLFSAPKVITSTPILVAIKMYYKNEAKTIDAKLDALTIKIFSDHEFGAREYERNRQEVSHLHGGLIRIDDVTLVMPQPRRKAVAGALVPFV
jgi:hypothetical protein